MGSRTGPGQLRTVGVRWPPGWRLGCAVWHSRTVSIDLIPRSGRPIWGNHLVAGLGSQIRMRRVHRHSAIVAPLFARPGHSPLHALQRAAWHCGTSRHAAQFTRCNYLTPLRFADLDARVRRPLQRQCWRNGASGDRRPLETSPVRPRFLLAYKYHPVPILISDK